MQNCLKYNQKICTLLLAACLLGCLLAPLAGMRPARAEDVTAACTFSLSGSTGEEKAFNPAKLLDGKYTTYTSFAGGDVLTIRSTAAFSSVYIIWDKIPGDWTLSADGRTYRLGTNGFLHEFADLELLTGGTAQEVTVTLPKDIAVCDIYVFTDGALPEWVQVWQPPCEKADLMLLSTHSDDEQLFFAGILPYYAGEIGAAVQVVYLTNHWDVQNRPHEQINGLWTVGVRNYPVVGPFPDDTATLSREGEAAAETLQRTLGIFGEDALIAFQVEMIRRFRPQVIVGHDINGEYQHGAHIANTYSLQKALTPAADVTQYPESAKQYGAWSVPKTYIHLWKENPITMDWDVPLAAFGGKTAFEVSKLGYACHRSQQWMWFTRWMTGTEDGDADTITKASQITSYSPCEYGLYQTAVGPDTKADFLDHITLYRDQIQDPSPVTSAPTPAVSASPTDGGRPGTTAPLPTQTNAASKKDTNLRTILIYCVVAVCVLCTMAVTSGRAGKKGRRP